KSPFIGVAAVGIQFLDASVVAEEGVDDVGAIINGVTDKDPPVIQAVGVAVNGDALRSRTVIAVVIIIGGDRPPAIAGGGGRDADGIIPRRHADTAVVLAVPGHAVRAAQGPGASGGNANSANRVGAGEDFNGDAGGGGFVEDIADIEARALGHRD